MQSIATSHAQNDSGLFELNFRDERYLPFEGAGVVSRWRIDLPKETNSFDFNTLQDVIFELKYTSRSGGDILRNAAQRQVEQLLGGVDGTTQLRMVRARQEFPDAWAAFASPTDQNSTVQSLSMDLDIDRFPFLYKGRAIDLLSVDIFLVFRDPQTNRLYARSSSLTFELVPDGPQPPKSLASVESLYGGTLHVSFVWDSPVSIPETLTFTVSEEAVKATAIEKVVTAAGQAGRAERTRLDVDLFEDLLFIFRYQAQKKA